MFNEILEVVSAHSVFYRWDDAVVVAIYVYIFFYVFPFFDFSKSLFGGFKNR